MKSKFAFLNHYLDTTLLLERQGFYFAKLLSYQSLKRLVALMPSYRFLNIGPIQTINGDVTEGVGIACPLLPEHFVTLSHDRVLKKLKHGIRIGERFGAQIIGLGGFTSVFGNEGEELAKCTKVPVTSGNTFTALQTIRGVLRAASLMERQIERSTVAIFGATGDIGSICSKIFARKAKVLLLVARNDKRLTELKEDLNGNASCNIRICKSTIDATREADIIITVTSALTTVVDPAQLKPGAIVCDVSYPANITREVFKLRKDAFVFEGGMSTLPGYDSLPQNQRERLQRYNPPGTIHGCLAETMLLALEGRHTYFSFGRGNITEAKLDEIGAMAARQGFGLPSFHCGTHFYTDEFIETLKRNAYSMRVN